VKKKEVVDIEVRVRKGQKTHLTSLILFLNIVGSELACHLLYVTQPGSIPVQTYD
jgi:hypothetical protein